MLHQYPIRYDDGVFSAAVVGGHVHVLEWYKQREGRRHIYREGTADCTAAAGAGHLDVLKWLRSLEHPCRCARECRSADAGRLQEPARYLFVPRSFTSACSDNGLGVVSAIHGLQRTQEWLLCNLSKCNFWGWGAAVSVVREMALRSTKPRLNESSTTALIDGLLGPCCQSGWW